ncbi:MAG TPA: hypothetical protein VIL00_03680 [Pseudonocardiaceae bacterium]
MRFPSRLLGANVVFALGIWLAFYLVVTLITLGIGVFGTLERSVWEVAATIPRWFALFVGVALVDEFLPVYLVHGRTRRRFYADTAVTILLFAPVLAVLLTLGYQAERLLYHLGGWPQLLQDPHLFASPSQVPLIFTEYLVEFLAWLVVGLLLGATFHRWGGGGLLVVPLCLGLILLAEVVTGEFRVPFLDLNLDLGVQPSWGIALAGGAVCYAVGMVLAWPALRDIPLSNSPR